MSDLPSGKRRTVIEGDVIHLRIDSLDVDEDFVVTGVRDGRSPSFSVRPVDDDPSEADLIRYYHSGGGEDPVSRQQIRDAGRPGL